MGPLKPLKVYVFNIQSYLCLYYRIKTHVFRSVFTKCYKCIVIRNIDVVLTGKSQIDTREK